MSHPPRRPHARPALASGTDAAPRVGSTCLAPLPPIQAREGSAIEVEGQVLRDFTSRDALGLAQHPEVVARLQECAAWRGVGVGGTALSGARCAEHAALEDTIATWQGYPRALVFGSSYLANLAVMQALLRDGDLCVQDHLNHVSLADGAKLAGAQLRSFPHGAADGALRQLQKSPDTRALLATDGVFDLDGDLAPLKLLAVLARAENATLYVCDGGGVGVLGPDGRGSVAHAGLGAREVPLQLLPLDTALGCAGAVLVGPPTLIDAVADGADCARQGDLLPPAMAAAALSALRLSRTESWRRYKLAALVARFRRGAQQLGLPMVDSSTSIQPIMIGANAAAAGAARALAQAGFRVAALRPASAPDGRARLRVALSALHEESDIDALLEALARALRAAAIIDA